MIFAAWKLFGDLRFLLEFVPVLLASLMLVVVYLTAKTIWDDTTVARLATLLFSLEISVWHHVHRGHGPGIFGAFFVLLYVWFLAAYAQRVRTWWRVGGLAALTLAVTLCYTVAFVQISIYISVLTAIVLVFGGKDGRSRLVYILVGFSFGIGGGLLLYYGPYIVDAVVGGGAVLDSGQAYDPPATFFVLRNQLRDTVRILQNGYPIFVGLSLMGLWALGRSNASAFHRSMLWAGFVTYLGMLVLKDPAVLPRIFLHAKEDLFFAPFACLLAALPLARLWTSRLVGKLVVVIIFIALFGLALRDQVINADTLSPQPIVFSRHGPHRGDARFV
jgi:hypothetical protein